MITKNRQILALFEVIDLPEGLQGRVDNLRRLQSDKAKVGGKIDVPHRASLLGKGHSPDDANRIATEAEEAEAARIQTLADLGKAIDSADRQIKKWLIDNADQVIEAINERVADLLEQAEPLAVKLEAFAPAYKHAVVAKKATAPQLKAFQQSRDLADTYRVCVQGWMRLWAMATVRPSVARPRPEHKPKVPGGIHVFRDPAAISDLEVRDGRRRDILHIAPYRRNFRLAGLAEIKKYEDGYKLVKPRHRRDYRTSVLELKPPVQQGTLH